MLNTTGALSSSETRQQPYQGQRQRLFTQGPRVIPRWNHAEDHDQPDLMTLKSQARLCVPDLLPRDVIEDLDSAGWSLEIRFERQVVGAEALLVQIIGRHPNHLGNCLVGQVMFLHHPEKTGAQPDLMLDAMMLNNPLGDHGSAASSQFYKGFAPPVFKWCLEQLRQIARAGGYRRIVIPGAQDYKTARLYLMNGFRPRDARSAEVLTWIRAARELAREVLFPQAKDGPCFEFDLRKIQFPLGAENHAQSRLTRSCGEQERGSINARCGAEIFNAILGGYREHVRVGSLKKIVQNLDPESSVPSQSVFHQESDPRSVRYVKVATRRGSTDHPDVELFFLVEKKRGERPVVKEAAFRNPWSHGELNRTTRDYSTSRNKFGRDAGIEKELIPTGDLAGNPNVAAIVFRWWYLVIHDCRLMLELDTLN